MYILACIIVIISYTYFVAEHLTHIEGLVTKLIYPLPPHSFIEVSVPRQESEMSCMCVLGASLNDVASVSWIFRNCSDSVIFMQTFHLIGIQQYSLVY